MKFVLNVVLLSEKLPKTLIINGDVSDQNVLYEEGIESFDAFIALTVVEYILLMIGGLSFFDSLLTSFSTAGTGGFATLNSSASTYSLFNKYVVAIFMFLFGVNFNIYFFILMKDVKSALKSEELKAYIMIFIFSVLFIFINTLSMFNNIEKAFNDSFFHVGSIMTSTGFAVGDINFYPTTSRIFILVLMLIRLVQEVHVGVLKYQDY